MLEMSVVFVFSCVTDDACVASRAVVLGKRLLTDVPSDEILFLLVVLSVSRAPVLVVKDETLVLILL
jgi:hypothetical protein